MTEQVKQVKNKVINLRVAEETKTQWEEWAEEQGYRTLSAFIEAAVEWASKQPHPGGSTTLTKDEVGGVKIKSKQSVDRRSAKPKPTPSAIDVMKEALEEKPPFVELAKPISLTPPQMRGDLASTFKPDPKIGKVAKACRREKQHKPGAFCPGCKRVIPK